MQDLQYKKDFARVEEAQALREPVVCREVKGCAQPYNNVRIVPNVRCSVLFTAVNIRQTLDRCSRNDCVKITLSSSHCIVSV